MKIKTYLINLEKSVDRKERALAETAKFPFLDVELVKAVYGKEMSEEEVEKQFDVKRFIYRYMRKPLPAEIGCTLSHKECYRRFLETNEQFALILEDDICFLDPDRVESVLYDLISDTKRQKADLITFESHNSYLKSALYESNKYVFYRIYEAYGTSAYLINRKAARKMLSVKRPAIVADDYTYMFRRGIVVHGIYPTFATGCSQMEELPSEVASFGLKCNFQMNIPYIYKFLFRAKNKIVGCLITYGWIGSRKIVKGINL